MLVEAKYVYKSEDFKKIEAEIMIDSIAYLKEDDRYKEIVVFIYDESASVEHHDLTRSMLLALDGVSDVIIVSRPGVLSTSTRLIAKRITRSGKESAPASLTASTQGLGLSSRLVALHGRATVVAGWRKEPTGDPHTPCRPAPRLPGHR